LAEWDALKEQMNKFKELFKPAKKRSEIAACVPISLDIHTTDERYWGFDFWGIG
jgi:hypothetical protein